MADRSRMNFLRLGAIRNGSGLVPSLIIGASLLGGAAVYSTAHSATAAAPAPSAVALVDIARVINGLHEMAERNAVIKAKGEQLADQLRTTDDEIKKIEDDLKNKIPPKDFAARAEAIGRAYEFKALLDTRKKIFQRQFDVMNGDATHELYEKAMAAIDAFARREGYDLVLFDDRALKLPDLGVATNSELNSLLEARRVFYARDGMDITDRIVTWMNQQYASGPRATGLGATGTGATPTGEPAPAAPVTPPQTGNPR